MAILMRVRSRPARGLWHGPAPEDPIFVLKSNRSCYRPIARQTSKLSTSDPTRTADSGHVKHMSSVRRQR